MQFEFEVCMQKGFKKAGNLISARFRETFSKAVVKWNG